MANTFYREATDGGDNDVWANFELNQNRLALGAITSKLYNDSGTLKLSSGRIGIDNGSNKGSCVIDTITTISLASVSSGNWAKIEVSVSGTSVTIAAADIAAATDEAIIPSEFTGAYNGLKGGYYITSTKRCIGLAWKSGTGSLAGIINTIGNTDRFSNFTFNDEVNKIITRRIAKSADYTQPNDTGFISYNYTCGTATKRHNLPSCALNKGLEVELNKADTGYGPLLAIPNGSDTIKNISRIFLWRQGDTLRLRSNGVSNWMIINGFKPYLESGWINTSDETNRNLGFLTLTYDNPSSADPFVYGDKITGSINGSYGICTYHDATTLVLCSVVGGGGNIFENNEELTGDLSSATALVNMASGAKNIDYDIPHYFNEHIRRILTSLHLSGNNTDGDSRKVGVFTDYDGANQYGGYRESQVNVNTLRIKTPAGGVSYLDTSGNRQVYASTDLYYNSRVQLI